MKAKLGCGGWGRAGVKLGRGVRQSGLRQVRDLAWALRGAGDWASVAAFRVLALRFQVPSLAWLGHRGKLCLG